MVIRVEVDENYMALVTGPGFRWYGRAPAWALQWQADRKVAYFKASDRKCLSSGLPAIYAEAKKEEYRG